MRTRLVVAAALAAVTAASRSTAQSLAQRVDGVRNGTVVLSFATRPGVCGDGNGSIWMQGPDDNVTWSRGRVCVVGPVRVRLGRSDGQTVSVRTCVACRPRGADAGDVDLGEVRPDDAAKYLLTLARDLGGRGAGDAVSAAAFADAGNLGPEFSRLVRDDGATLEARKQALFWFGQSDGPTRDLIAVYDDLRPYTLREHYTFVLSQRRDDAALSKLIDIARNDSDSHVRKQAMFWIGQSKDPKAIDFIRNILVR